jgi:hypothetical protein
MIGNPPSSEFPSLRTRALISRLPRSVLVRPARILVLAAHAKQIGVKTTGRRASAIG